MHFSTSTTSAPQIDPSDGGILTIRSRRFMPSPQVALQMSHSPHSVTRQLLGATQHNIYKCICLQKAVTFYNTVRQYQFDCRKSLHVNLVKRNSINDFDANMELCEVCEETLSKDVFTHSSPGWRCTARPPRWGGCRQNHLQEIALRSVPWTERPLRTTCCMETRWSTLTSYTSTHLLRVLN